MKLLTTTLMIVCLSFSSGSFADAASEKEAEKLLNTMEMQAVMEQSMTQMLDIQMQQNPALIPYRDVMMDFLNKYVSYASLKPELLKMYSEAFTASELSEINDFYATDVGKKALEKMPVLMAQGAQIGAARVQDNAQELQTMIQTEAMRIQSQQQ